MSADNNRDESQRDPAGKLIAALVDDVTIAPDAALLFDIDVEPLAEGSCATIHHAREKNSESSRPKLFGIDGYAFKIFVPNAYQSAGDELSALHTELSAFLAIPQHPNLLKYFNTFWLSNGVNEERALHSRWALQFEYCSGGDIYTAATQHPLAEMRAQSVMNDILKAIAHMNLQNLCHRDVKPENILIAGNRTCKLADFGLCAQMSDEKEMKKRCGTPGYVAPEVWLGTQYGANVDTFSAGAVLFFMLTGKMLFYGSGLPSIMRKTVHNEVDFSKSKRLENLTQACKDFVTTLLMKQPDLRPTARFALRSPWILNLDLDAVNVGQDSPRRVRSWTGGHLDRQCSSISSEFSTTCGSILLSEGSSFDNLGRIDTDGWPHPESQPQTSASHCPSRAKPTLPFASCKSVGHTPDHSPTRARGHSKALTLSSASSTERPSISSNPLQNAPGLLQHPLQASSTERPSILSNPLQNTPGLLQHPLQASAAWQTPDNSPVRQRQHSKAFPVALSPIVVAPMEPDTPRSSWSLRKVRDLQPKVEPKTPSKTPSCGSSQLAKLCEVVAQQNVTEDVASYDVHPPNAPTSPRKSSFLKLRNFVRSKSKTDRSQEQN